MGKVAMTADLAIVLAFAGIGRAAHDHGLTIVGLASTAWPFLAGLGVGWLVLATGRLGRRDGMSVSSGLVVWISTVVLGMVFRVISGQGTAVAFIFVALGFLGLTMIGWRALVSVLRQWQGSTPPSAAGPASEVDSGPW